MSFLQLASGEALLYVFCCCQDEFCGQWKFFLLPLLENLPVFRHIQYWASIDMVTHKPKWAASNTDSPLLPCHSFGPRCRLYVMSLPDGYAVQIGQIDAAEPHQDYIVECCNCEPLTAMSVGSDGRAMPFLAVGIELYASEPPVVCAANNIHPWPSFKPSFFLSTWSAFYVPSHI